MTKRRPATNHEGGYQKVCGSPLRASPVGGETAGGGLRSACAAARPFGKAESSAPSSSSFPCASDHVVPSDAPAVSRHPSGDKVNQQPPLNAANPFSCSSPGASFERLTGLPRSLPEPNPSDQFDATLSFREWAAALPRWILKSRSPFAAWLASSFRSPASRWGAAPPSATFPLPLPFLGLFSGSGPRLSKVSWRRLRLRRVLHILVLALNFVHEGLRVIPSELLWRVPNAHQRKAYDRLMRHLVACDSRSERFPLPPGRSGPESLARLLELEQYATCAFSDGAGSAGVLTSAGPRDLGPQLGLGLGTSRPELHPYRSLDTSRLKLTGRGAWNAEPWLQGPLWLPFVEPRCMLHGRPISGCDVPNFEAESRSENLSLARLWSAQGLLGLIPGEPHPQHLSRVFNAYKDATRDRQIGDRRLANIAERHMQGPSADLPPGFLLAGLVVPRFRAQVAGYCSGRKDFYHQFMVTEERASTNLLAFSYDGEELGSEVLARSPVLWEEASPAESLDRLTPCFRSLYQGDHMGVEFALAAHASLLKYGGALPSHTVLLNHRAFPMGDTVQALVIDDLVGLSVLSASCDPRGPSPARLLHQAAGRVYDRFEVLGSPEKDVTGESLFTAIGCEIDSRRPCVRRGLVTAAAPLGRRLGLASLSLRAARLGVTSSGLVSRLTGAWTSAFLFRRCCMVVLSEAFSVANRAAEEPRLSKRPFPLSHRLAQEFVLASVLSVVACADLTAEVADRVYATDASLARGAVCSCSVPTQVAKSLWQNGDRRGAYSRLEEGPKILLRAAGLAPEEEDVADDPDLSAPLKQVPFRIDVLELGCCGGFLGGPGLKEGVDLGPLISPSASRHYDILAPSFAAWLSDMIQGGWVRGLLLCPPCASCATGPGKAGLKRCLSFFCLANALHVPCLLLLPGPVGQAHAGEIEKHASLPSCQKRWLSSSRLGADGPGGWVCLSTCLDATALDSFSASVDAKAPCHLSQVERELLGREILRCFSRAFLAQQGPSEKVGIESVAVNDVLAGGSWRVDLVLPWKGDSHINVLELATVVALHRQLAAWHPDSRVTVLVDSQVAKSAAAKGRSSSRSLGFALMRSSALQVAFGLFVAYGFAPTRLNIADDPTRFVDLRAPSSRRLFESLPAPVWHAVSAVRMRRPVASWARLFLLVAFDSPSDKAFLESLLAGPFSC